MSIEHHHDLAQEFPEFKEHIHHLKQTNPHFARLYKEYADIDHTLYRSEQEIEIHGDQYIEELKKKRALLKDKLYQILRG